MNRSICGLIMALVLGGNLVHSSTLTWTNTSGGNWSVANNWSPHQVPTNTDNALITFPGTYTVTFDLNGSVVTNVTLGAGGGAAGVQTLAITANLQFAFINLLATNGGVLAAQGCYLGYSPSTMTVNGGALHLAANKINSSLLVTNGGVVISTNDIFYYAAMTVAHGGGLNAGASTFYGPVTVTDGGLLTVVDVQFQFSGLTVAPGGEVDISHDPASIFTYTDLEGPLNNSGTINLTNAVLHIEGYFAYYGGLVNQPGGVINLQGSAGLVSSVGYPPSQFFGYIVNQGMITQLAGTNSLSAPFFDNTLGTITNLSGTMVLGTYQTNLAGTYFAAAGATIQFNAVNDGTNFVTPGRPLVMAGTGQYQFISGDLKYPTNTISNLSLQGGLLALGPAFQGGAITNLALDGIWLANTLPVTGTLTVTNSLLFGNFTVASGGTLYVTNAEIRGAVTVANGGLFSANVVSIYAPLTLAGGSGLNLAGFLNLYAPLTNSGVINLTNSPINIYNYSVYQGGIANQAGGAINLWGNGANIAGGGGGPEFFINRGRITQCVGASTNRINVLGFDTSQGTVTNLAGTLVLGTFYTNLAGIYFAAAGATIQFSGGTAGTPMTLGTPLTLGGAGQCAFTSGYLYLPTNGIPGLQLLGGTLKLGANFQGGAITNLILGGMTLTNTLPVTGTFTVTNSLLYGSFTVASGGVLNENAGAIHAAVMVANGGLFNAFNPAAGATVSADGSLTVASGARLNLAGGLQLFGPLTNAGTINITNSPVFVLNNGTISAQGGVVNQTGGLIDFWADGMAGIFGGFGNEYLINQGSMTKSAGVASSAVNIAHFTNSGVITAQSGIMQLGTVILQPAGSLNTRLNSATNYGAFIINGNAALTGTFNATLNNGYVPTNGTTFNVLSYGSFTGSFTSLGLPSVVNWQSNYGSTNFTLVASSAKPQFAAINLLGTNLIFTGIGGSPGSNYVVLASTNLTLPFANWSALMTNKFDSSGQFHYTNHVSPAKSRQFFIFKLP